MLIFKYLLNKDIIKNSVQYLNSPKDKGEIGSEEPKPRKGVWIVNFPSEETVLETSNSGSYPIQVKTFPKKNFY